MSSAPLHYRPMAIILHWAIAALLIFQLGLGWHMTDMPRSAVMFAAFQFHKSIGMAILLLSVLRVAVRVASPRPAPVEGPRWQTLLASGVHGLLYLFMIGGPLTGWALVSTAPVAMATLLFHTVPLPHLPISHDWHDGIEAGHSLLAWLGAGLIVLHIGGALKHQLAARREEWVVPRMMPAHVRSVWGALVLALGGLGVSFALPWGIYRAAPVSAAAVTPAPVTPTPVAPVPVASEAPAVEEAPVAAASAEPDKPLTHDWAIEPGGRLGFSATVNGGPVEGRFGKWTGKVTYDPDHPEAAKLTVTVQLVSASSGDQTRDGMLQGPEFFGSSPMGRAVFVANGFKPAGGSKFAAEGRLSINGVTVPVTLNFDLRIADNAATVKGSARLDRAALHVGTGQWSGTDQIGSEVGLSFNLKAHRK
ncbi:YceI family protein [Novosphingobium sediminicola]|uniref:Cytochrome b561/polyisoprenoid-binding protein YceI n=1 Tax=Novosphingobium sediminicola TaxID=563162 RepID=A0A7W6CML2_9SPHN|nr:YceI family protein [Novosphingobium sediminicola]MBB3954262.1 cytochrome b561/polyisoprenoid-binding protein YceI [Novosphingobium sediminicola]